MHCGYIYTWHDTDTAHACAARSSGVLDQTDVKFHTCECIVMVEEEDLDPLIFLTDTRLYLTLLILIDN